MQNTSSPIPTQDKCDFQPSNVTVRVLHGRHHAVVVSNLCMSRVASLPHPSVGSKGFDSVSPTTVQWICVCLESGYEVPAFQTVKSKPSIIDFREQKSKKGFSGIETP
ncbi:hypothetical protein SLE2022_268900 [Rubroshorea leprosula]